MPEHRARLSRPLYGLTKFSDLFTARQLVALTTFSDLVEEARERVKRDASLPACPTTASPCATAALARRPMPRQWGCILALCCSTRRLTWTARALYLGAAP